MLFKHLSAEDEKTYRQWARVNYKPFSDIKGIWHPIVQDECRIMNEETGYAPSGAPPGITTIASLYPPQW